MIAGGERNRAADVVVVGAGPAGLTAAAALATDGFRVLVLEKTALPRPKPCGGGIVTRARRSLPHGGDVPFERLCTQAVCRIADLGLSFRVSRDEPIVAMVSRAEFDGYLARRAEAAGARILNPCRVRAVRRDGETMIAATSSGEFRARMIIAADGAFSTVARKMGLGRTAVLAPALAAEIPLDDLRIPEFQSAAWFDFAFVPAGYAWAFPKRRHLSVGVVTRGTVARLHAALRRYVSFLGLEPDFLSDARGFAIPFRPHAPPFARDGVLLAGDAAGLADPVTFEGISNALLSGALAARALRVGDMRSPAVRELYDDLLETHILRDLRWGARYAALLYEYPVVRGWVLRRYGEAVVEALADVMSGERSYRGMVAGIRAYRRKKQRQEGGMPPWGRNQRQC